VFPSLWTDEEVDGRLEVYVRRLGTAECPHFLAEGSKQETYLQLGLNSQNKMKSCTFVDDKETAYMGKREQYIIQISSSSSSYS
jgi:hypothetical protein